MLPASNELEIVMVMRCVLGMGGGLGG
jgi:hypothetical protein